MNKHITKETLKKYNTTIINTGYRGLGILLQPMEDIGYNAGIYGWNWTAYHIDGILIVDGYRNAPTKAIIPNYQLMNEYNNKGKGKSKDEKLQLIREFIKEILKN